MLLKSIELCNFGRYEGKNLFDTTVTPDRNVILVKAKNDRGKTTLFQAIKFALYGDDGLMPKSSNEWINFQAAAKNNGEMYVELNFEHEGKNYKIRRVSKFEKTERGQDIVTIGNPIIELFENDNPHMAGVSESNKKEWIDTILPKDASQFFFFDGEEIQRYIQNEETHVKQAIEKVLGIKELLNAKIDLCIVLERFKEETSKNLRKHTKDNKSRTELERIDGDIKQFTEDIKSETAFLNGAEARKTELEKQQAKYTAIKDKVNERSSVEEELKIQNKKLISIKKELAIERANLGLILLSPFLKMLNEAKEDPPTIDRWQSDTANYILHNLDKCVCNHPIDQQIKIVLKSKILDIKPTKTSIIKKSANSMLIDHTPALKQEELLRKLTDMSNINQSIDEHKSTLDGLKKEIQDSSTAEELKQLEVDYEAVVKDIGKSEDNLKRLENYKLKNEQEKKVIEARINSSVVDQELILSQQKRDMCEKILDCIDTCIEKFYQDRKPELERHISQIFSSLTNNPDMYRGLKISRDFSMKVVRNDDTELPTHKYSPSAGASQIVATSMIGGLNKFATRDAPVIIDTPMGRLDPDHRHNLIKYYSKMSKQIIILYQPSELGDNDIQNINDHLASEWIIEPKPDHPDLSYLNKEKTHL